MRTVLSNLFRTVIVLYLYFIAISVVYAQKSQSGQIASPNATCGDMGGENGWSAWKASTGKYSSGIVTFDVKGASPYAPRFVLTAGGGFDSCTPGPNGGPPLPVVAPGFGRTSIQLGQLRTNGDRGDCGQSTSGTGAGCAEQLTYPFTVTAADTNFIYAYAIVLENPNNPKHTYNQVPYAEIYILDQKGDTVSCSHQKYIGDTTGKDTVQPGFFKARCNGPDQNGMDVVYKPWTTVGVNLNKYVGQTLRVVITNVDCSLGGHFCHSYWDFACPPITGSDPEFCLGSETTLIAPPSSSANPYTYEWYQNGKPYTGLPNDTSAVITPTPKSGDTYAVHVHQTSGCDFWLPYNPKPITITPDFASVGSCSQIDFTDKSTTSNGSAIASWNWNFGGGTPNTSTVQNPTGIKYSPGTYTVTLIVTSAAGCTDTIQYPVTIKKPPIANFNSNVVCFNNPTIFNDLSTGTPAPIQWNWDFGDGNTSNTQNPTHTYGTAGSFTATLIAIDSNGCKDTIKQPVFVNPLPSANFSSQKVCFGNPTCFTDLSTISSGSITGLSWNFGEPTSGADNISTLPAPCHKYAAVGNYSVTLTVTSDSGCQSTIVLPVTFNPPPVALFSSSPVCVNVPTNFVSNSTSSSSDPISIWDWNFGDGGTSSISNPSHIYAAGSYTVTLIVTTAGGCKDTIQKPVTVHELPSALFSKPDSGCSPVYGNFTDLSTSTDGTVSAWAWSFPGGEPSRSSLQNPTNIKYVTPGTYSVSLFVTSAYGCMDSISLPMIEVFPWPNAEFCVSPPSAPATDPVFNFCDMWSKDVVKWVWNFGDGTIDSSSTVTDPIHSYTSTVNQNDFYSKQICIHVQNRHGCWDTICHTVELVPEFVFYIPNTFTPNGDGNNEMFYGKCRGVKEYNIWLFDRWGNQIWSCHKEDKNTNWDSDITNPRQEGLASACQWDGVVVQGGLDMGGNSGTLAQEDVYVWKVSLIDVFNKRHTYIGHVNIVR